MQELYAVNETKQLRTRFCNYVLNDSISTTTEHRRTDIISITLKYYGFYE